MPQADRRARPQPHDRLDPRAPRLRDPAAAQTFLDGALPGHDPSPSATCPRPSPRSGPRSRRANGSASTATTTPTASAPPRWRCCCCASSARRPLAAALALRGGLRPRGADLDAARRRGCRLRPERRLRHHRHRRGRRGGAAGDRGGRHRPSPARRALPRLPGGRAAEGRLPVRRPLRHRGGVEARAGAARARPPVLERHLDIVAIATIADIVPLAGREPGARTARSQPPGPAPRTPACGR